LQDCKPSTHGGETIHQGGLEPEAQHLETQPAAAEAANIPAPVPSSGNIYLFVWDNVNNIAKI
jgi:hypothetical protein